MNKRSITAVLGLLLLILAGFMAVPLCIALSTQEDPGEILGLELGVGASIFSGALLFLFFRRRLQEEPLGTREGLAITTFGWLLLTAFGALPFLFSEKAPLSFTDAYFEVMSGLTTTGSTVLPQVEKLPSGLLFWRSLTHWIGGMGIILLSVAILAAEFHPAAPIAVEQDLTMTERADTGGGVEVHLSRPCLRAHRIQRGDQVLERIHSRVWLGLTHTALSQAVPQVVDARRSAGACVIRLGRCRP